MWGPHSFDQSSTLFDNPNAQVGCVYACGPAAMLTLAVTSPTMPQLLDEAAAVRRGGCRSCRWHRHELF
jgi:hypothetical protein